mgnify:CR=1 FL=1|tara:strand:+ start:597 stop:698 length:102 start_codon:yes stop_codon:yes gene_type:complete
MKQIYRSYSNDKIVLDEIEKIDTKNTDKKEKDK